MSIKLLKGKTGRLIIVIIFTLIIYFLPTPSDLSQAGKNAFVALFFTGLIFSTQPISLPFTSLLVAAVLVLLGIANVSQAFEPLSRPIIILILGSLILAESIRKHGLSRRLALLSVVYAGGNVKLTLLGLMGIAGFLSMWMENTAAAAIILPLSLTVSNLIPDKEESNKFKQQLVLGIAYSSSIGGMSTIMGSASNAVAIAFLSQISPWTFLDWLRYGLLSLLIIFPITYFIVLKILPTSIKSINIDIVKKELYSLGKISYKELEILSVLLVTILLWIFGPQLEAMFFLPMTLLSPAIIAVFSVIYLALRGIIDWDDTKGVSWGMFLTISAGLALGEALTRTGASEWATEIIKPLVIDQPYFISLTLLVLSSALLTNIMNNATIVAIYSPILLTLSNYLPGIDATRFIVPVALATTFGYSLPSASGRMALLSATGLIDRDVMLKKGLIVTLISSLCLIVLFTILNAVDFI
ncbi:DASS family sodium-coupled anion symporter [Candidatus Bathyarchaeota archaeon]|nr:DASS family sodium-coupled anion symporter [Candidatus Bathyarchaeota archaeon]